MDPEKTPAPAGEQKPASGGAPVDLSATQAKRGRGRPRKPLVARAAAAADAKRNSPAGKADSLLDAAFLSESACCLVEIVDEVIGRTLAARIAKAVPTKLADFVKLQESVGFGEKDREMVGLSVEAMASKYEWMTKFGAEVFLVAWATQYSVRQARLLKFVNEMVAAQEKLNGIQQPAPRPLENITQFPGPAQPASRS